MAATPEAPERNAETTASPIDSHSSPVKDRRGHSGLSTAAMVLGIVGIPVALFVPIVAIVLGVLAIVLGAVGRGDARRRGATNTGQAMAGIILGSIDIVLAIASAAIYAANH